MKLIAFDCDSTLSSIEGIDELARLAGTHTFEQVQSLTHAAMNGEVQLDSVFAKRLSIISPTKSQATEIAQLYIDTVEPSAQHTIQQVIASGWTPLILSGGFKPLIKPLASFLAITHIEAVPLFFHPDGSFDRFDPTYPTTYNGGKPEILRQLIKQWNPSQTIMVGDGISDLETQDTVDHFVGFGRYTPRQKVRAQADFFIDKLSDLLTLGII